MKVIAYLSQPTDYTNISETLLAIEKQSKSFNSKNEISGALFFTGKHFLQVIEGPEDAVDTLMASIMKDSRHHDIHILFANPEHSRTLPAWNMQPLDLTDQSLFSKANLERASEIVGKTMKLDAEGFVYLITDMLEEPEFQQVLAQQA
jgi:hypothetical protein